MSQHAYYQNTRLPDLGGCLLWQGRYKGSQPIHQGRSAKVLATEVAGYPQPLLTPVTMTCGQRACANVIHMEFDHWYNYLD